MGDSTSEEVELEGFLNSRARRTRRATVERRVEEERETGMVEILSADVKRGRMWRPYSSELFTTEYNMRLPGWRMKATQSAHHEHWPNWKEYQLVATATGLDIKNLLFFPFFAASNGQGMFVIVFIILNFLVGFPLLFLQLALGQFSSRDAVRVFSVLPLAQGMGITLYLLNLISLMGTAIRSSWIVFYIMGSFQFTWDIPEWKVAWQTCNVTKREYEKGLQCGVFEADSHNHSQIFLCAQKYFYDFQYGALTANCSNMNQISWPQIGCLFIVYVLLYLFSRRGIKSIGKVVRFLIPSICFCLLVYIFGILLVSVQIKEKLYSAFAENYAQFKPDYHYLMNIELWLNVITMVISSLSLDTGIMITIGSYANFQSAAHRHAFYVVLADTALSLLSSFFLFAFVGILNTMYGLNITIGGKRKVPDMQVTYFSIALTTMEYVVDFTPVWILIMFSTLLCCGLVNMAAMSLVITAPLYGWFPSLTKKRKTVNFIVDVVIFTITVPVLSMGEVSLKSFLALKMYPPMEYASVLILIIVTSAFIYGYGLKCLRQDFDFMLQFYPNIFFAVVWLTVPVILSVFFLVALYYRSSKFMEISYPGDPNIVWWMFVMVFLPIPLWAVVTVTRYHRRGELSLIFQPLEEMPWSLLPKNKVGQQKETPQLGRREKQLRLMMSQQSHYQVRVEEPLQVTIRKKPYWVVAVPAAHKKQTQGRSSQSSYDKKTGKFTSLKNIDSHFVAHTEDEEEEEGDKEAAQEEGDARQEDG